MLARTAHARPPRPRKGVGGEWIEPRFIMEKDQKDFSFNEDGLYIGDQVSDIDEEYDPMARFLLATLLIGVLLRLIGLVQYTGFKAEGSKLDVFKLRVSTLRQVARAGSRLALGASVSEVLELATLNGNSRNYAFEIIEKLVSVFESEPLEGEDNPVAAIARFIREHQHLDSNVSEDVRNTDAEVYTSDLSQEFELVHPRLVDYAERPPSSREHRMALKTAKRVLRLVNSQVYDPCFEEMVKIGHFPYYKRKNSTAVDWDLMELSMVKFVLQKHISQHHYGSKVCEHHHTLRWYTPFRFIRGERTIEEAVTGLAVSAFGPEERRTVLPLPPGYGYGEVHPTIPALGPSLSWVPPWHPNHHICGKEKAPNILERIGDMTMTRIKGPIYYNDVDYCSSQAVWKLSFGQRPEGCEPGVSPAT
jgi:hypothetical protein